jgi:hypothetical protein
MGPGLALRAIRDDKSRVLGIDVRTAAALLALALSTSPPAAQAAPVRAAVFDFELVDTSLEGEIMGKSAVETARVAMLSARLRDALAASGTYEIVDIAPVREEASRSNLQSCGGCDRMARQIGADLSVTGVVQKVSNLILNINIYVRDAATGVLVGGGTVDIRSNTNESWRRGLDWLLKHRTLKQESTP